MGKQKLHLANKYKLRTVARVLPAHFNIIESIQNQHEQKGKTINDEMSFQMNYFLSVCWMRSGMKRET